MAWDSLFQGGTKGAAPSGSGGAFANLFSDEPLSDREKQLQQLQAKAEESAKAAAKLNTKKELVKETFRPKNILQAAKDVTIGAVRSIPSTIIGGIDAFYGGRAPAVNVVPGINQKAFKVSDETKAVLAPTNNAQKTGMVLGDLAQYALPGPGEIKAVSGAPRLLNAALKYGPTAARDAVIGTAQTDSKKEGAVIGATSLVLNPIVEKVLGRIVPLLAKAKTPKAASEILASETDLPTATIDTLSHHIAEIDNPEEIRKLIQPATPDEHPLAAEARKYGSADEFVDSHAPMYRADSKAFDASLVKEDGYTPGTYFSKNKAYADEYGSASGRPVSEYRLTNDAKVLKYEDLPEQLKKKPTLNNNTVNESRDIFNYAKERGYDAVESEIPTKGSSRQTEEFTVINPDKVKTPQELKDIYTQATKTGNKAVIPVNETKTSGLAKDIAAKAKEAGIGKDIDELVSFEGKTVKDQSERVAKLITEDETKARAIIRGTEEVPNGMSASMFIKGMEEHATKTKDWQLLADLANSKLTSDTSIHAQELRFLAERNPNSPAVAANNLAKAREGAAVKKFGKGSRNATVKDIQASIKKASKKQTLSEFIDEITC